MLYRSARSLANWIAEGTPTTAELPSYDVASTTAQPGDDSVLTKHGEVRAEVHRTVLLAVARHPSSATSCAWMLTPRE
jgi:hypothetical protein